MTTPTLADLEGRVWFDARQAALYSGMHWRTITDALRDGSLSGSQRVDKGKWRIHRDDLDNWLRGGAS